MSAGMAELPEKRQQVSDFVLKQIAAGLKTGDLLWPEHKLSRRLGVSKSTVRRAVRDLVEMGVVRQQQGKGSFVNDARHPRVSAFALDAIRMVGFLSPFAHFDDGFMREITLGAEQALDYQRFLLVAKHVHIPLYREADVLPGLVEKVQGLLWLPTMDAPARKMIDDLHRRHFPFVLVDRYPPDLPCCCVASDNVEVGAMGTRHLLDLGHRRILHLTRDEDISSTHEREEGYTLLIKQEGLTPRVVRIPHPVRVAETLAATLGPGQGHRPTALLCLNDSIAIQCCVALKGLGIRVPEEISVIGVDDDPEAATCEVPLTTVAQARRQMGFKAARLLEGLMDGTVKTDTRLLLQPTLVIRKSTAPAPYEKQAAE